MNSHRIADHEMAPKPRYPYQCPKCGTYMHKETHNCLLSMKAGMDKMRFELEALNMG